MAEMSGKEPAAHQSLPGDTGAGLTNEAVPAREYLVPLLVLLLIFAVFYGQSLTGFSISIDDELGAFRSDPGVWLRQGRWGTYLFARFVMPQTTVPFLPVALFGVFGSIAYLVLLRAFGILRPAIIHYALFPIFIAFPTWQFIAAFAGNITSTGLGVLACSFAALLFRTSLETRHGLSRLAWSVLLQALLGAVAIGLYQSLVLFQITVFIGIVLMRATDDRASARDLVRYLSIASVSTLLSVTLYLLIARLALYITGEPMSYIQSFFQPGLLLSMPMSIIDGVALEAWRVYTGDAWVYGVSVPGLAIPVMLGLASLIVALKKAYAFARAAAATLVAMGVFVAPFLLNFANGGFMPYRALVAVPAAVWLFGLIAFSRGPGALLRGAFFLLPVVYFQILTVSAGFQAAGVLVRLHDQQLAGAVYQRIVEAVPDFSLARQYQIDFYGGKSFDTIYPRIRSSTIGYSFFEWDWGSSHRIIAYMKLLGLINLTATPPDKQMSLVAEYDTMPTWPAKGAVRVVDGVVLIKLSDSPGLHHALPPVRIGSKDPPSLFRLSTSTAGMWQLNNASNVTSGSEGLSFDAAVDPMLTFRTGAIDAVQACYRVEVDVLIQVERPDVAQLFYYAPGDLSFSEAKSSMVPIGPGTDGSFVEIAIQVLSPYGFADHFRFDPVSGGQHVTVMDLELRCRHSS